MNDENNLGRRLRTVTQIFGMTFGNPDFVSYTQAYGIAGSRVERVESLVPTLEAAFVRGGVQLVTVPIDYSVNMRVLVDKLRNHAPAGRRPSSQ
jgi:acetolactate synthase I/II/III large subunit